MNNGHSSILRLDYWNIFIWARDFVLTFAVRVWDDIHLYTFIPPFGKLVMYTFGKRLLCIDLLRRSLSPLNKPAIALVECLLHKCSHGQHSAFLEDSVQGLGAVCCHDTKSVSSITGLENFIKI
jgi:hypothetical protein